MLIDEQYCDVFPLFCETLEGRFDCGVIGLVVHHEEVLLRVWRRIDVLPVTLVIFK